MWHSCAVLERASECMSLTAKWLSVLQPWPKLGLHARQAEAIWSWVLLIFSACPYDPVLYSTARFLCYCSVCLCGLHDMKACFVAMMKSICLSVK